MLSIKFLLHAKVWLREQDLNENVLCCSYIDLVTAVNVDCVYIPLPCALRKEWAIACAKVGKSILIEKPTALSSDDLIEIITVCKENNVQFMDGTHFSHHDRLDKMKTFLNSGEIGNIVRINSSFSFYGDEDFLNSNIRTTKELEPFGCIGDLGWYNIRFCLWALDLELPISVRAFTTKWSKGGTPIDTISHLQSNLPLHQSNAVNLTRTRKNQLTN
jgi:predicted dehydrogenase